jgi:hypothetical protein
MASYIFELGFETVRVEECLLNMIGVKMFMVKSRKNSPKPKGKMLRKATNNIMLISFMIYPFNGLQWNKVLLERLHKSPSLWLSVAAQIIDLLYTLCIMGILIGGPAWLFGDNESVVTSINYPKVNI